MNCVCRIVTSAACAVVVGFLLAGCGKKPSQPKEPGPASAAGAVSVENLLGNPAAAAPTPPPVGSPAQPAEQPQSESAPTPPNPTQPQSFEITSAAEINGNIGAELKGGELATPQVIALYNRRLAMVNFQLSDYPASLEQLKKWPLMPAPPKAPPGKRIVYDNRTHQIRLDPP